MKIVVENVDGGEEESIVIRCRKMTDELRSIVHSLQIAADGITAYCDGEILKIGLSDVYWFEVVENKAFFYLSNAVYESKLKLYEFEQLTEGTRFFRATKSTVINADKIVGMAPTFSGRFIVTFDNGEKGTVSRGYVCALKKLMGIGGAK